MKKGIEKTAYDVVRLLAARKKGKFGPHATEHELEVTGMRTTSRSSRQHVALLALMQPSIFAECIERIDNDYRRSNKSFLAHLDDAIADPGRVGSISRYWCWRGITADVAPTMVKRRAAGRRVALPKYVPKPDDVARMAVYLARLREIVRVDAPNAAIRAQEDKAIADADAAKAAAEATWMEELRLATIENDEMVACGDDELLRNMD